MIVLIADDHSSITFAATHLAEQVMAADDRHEVGIASDVAQLFQHLEQVGNEPCLLVLDLNMPGDFKGLTLIREVLQVAPNARIVVYSASESPLLVEAALELGIFGYVSKRASLPRLKAAMKAVMVGKTYIDPGIDLEAAQAHPWKGLTPAEREVLIALAKGQNVRDLAEESGRAYTTVTNHKYAAMSKLDLANGDIYGWLVESELTFLLDP